MGLPGGFEKIRRDADTAASAFVAALADRKRRENVSVAATVHHLHDLVDLRLCTEAEIYEYGQAHGRYVGRDPHGVAEPDVYKARIAAECEAAVALSQSRTVTRDMITTGEQLATRLLAVDASFTAGDLDYPRVRAIALTMAKACDATVAALETDILAAARRCSVKALTENIWKYWTAHDPDEASAARRKAESEERGVSIRRGCDGTASLFATLTVVEAAEFDAVLNELAATVCHRDPRTKKHLRGDALIALAHHEDIIVCQCRTDDCPVAGAAERLSPRRPALVQVLVDIETLLGLSDTPAALADGTVLDADTARLVATNAQWRGLLTEMHEAATAHLASLAADMDTDRGSDRDTDRGTGRGSDTGNDTDTDTDTDRGTGNSPTAAKPRPEEHTDDWSESDATDADTPPTDVRDTEGTACSSGVTASESRTAQDTSGPADTSTNASSPNSPSSAVQRQRPAGPRARKLLKRGRIRPSAPLPAPNEESVRAKAARSTTIIGQGTALSAAIEEFLTAAKADPTIVLGQFPDGHGGLLAPPPGALTYRPTAALVALVRATYATCTFPECTVPSARCDIDHIVPFDHGDPPRGGWTVRTNLHPVCPHHHRAKTLELWSCAALAGDAVYWRSTSGLHRITLPTFGTVMVPETFVHNRPHPHPVTIFGNQDTYSAAIDLDDPPDRETPAGTLLREAPDELYEPTWWEIHISDTDTHWESLFNPGTRTSVPTLGDIARLTDPQARADATYLRAKFLEHRAIVTERAKRRPPPF